MRSFPLSADLADIRVTVMGLGRFGGGVAAVRFLARRGAHVTVTDLRTDEELRESLQQLNGCQLERVVTGCHADDAFSRCEMLIVNPAVKPDNPQVEACRARGVTISSEVELFLQHNPAFTIAVTGSNGKSTTCQLIHDILHQSLPKTQRVWLGGNIGRSLLPHVDDIRADDIVVLELSSFQLHRLSGTGFRPDVAVVTGFTANHIDWHGSTEHYRRSKLVISESQKSSDAIVLPNDMDDWPHAARCLRFGLNDGGEDGTILEDGSLIVRIGRHEDAERLTLPAHLQADHVQHNIAAAVAACRLSTTHPLQLSAALSEFRPLPHRLEVVARAGGRCFIDDSAATTPESLIVALRSLQTASNRTGCVLIAGGHDKGSPIDAAARQIVGAVRSVVTIGSTAERLAAAVKQSAAEQFALEQSAVATQTPDIVIATDFPTAFEHAVALSRPGDIVLLSPGFAAFGWFEDFRDRGNRFRALAEEWCASQDEKP